MVFLQADLFAQNRIEGIITDEENIPMVGATVFLPELSKGTVSDRNGYYMIDKLPDGKIRIQYSFIGYANKIITIRTSGEGYRQDIKLHLAPVETEEIVITGGFNATQHENAVKIERMKMDLLNLKSSPNLSEILTKVPGIDMISKGSGVSKPVIRGLSMNDILILNNGVRIENYQYSDHHPLGIDEFGIEDIEIIKGPASLLYGSDAIGGVINFIREKPAPVGQTIGDYNLQLFSNTLGITNNFGIRSTGKNLFGGIRIGNKSNADYLQGGGEFVPNTRFHEYSVKLYTGYTGGSGTFRLFYDFNKQNLGLAEEEAIETITERGRECMIFYQQLNTHLLSSQNKIYLGRMKLGINGALQNTELIHFGEPGIYELQMKLTSLTYEAKLYLPSDMYSEYIVGFQGFYQVNSNLNHRETILLPDANSENYSLFTMMQRTFFTRLKMQAGIRYDYRNILTKAVGLPDQGDYRPPLDKYYDSFSGSAGITWSASHELMFRINAAAAYRTPNLAELTSNGQHETRYERGDEDLIPEKSVEMDLSMHLHRDNITIDIAGFYNRIANYIFIAPTGDTLDGGLPVYLYRQNNSNLYGGEAGIHIHPGDAPWIHFQATYSKVLGIQDNGDYLPFIPADKLNFEIRFEKDKILFLERLFISLASSSAFKQNRPAPEENATPKYNLLDLSLGTNIRLQNQQITWVFSITNLLDEQYADHLSTLKESGIYNPGRNYTFTLRIPFALHQKE